MFSLIRALKKVFWAFQSAPMERRVCVRVFLLRVAFVLVLV